MGVCVVLGARCNNTGGGPSGDITFVAFGDTPYNWFEERQFENLVDALNADTLDFVLHVGDLLWRPCSDEKLRERLEALQRIRHPVAYTPGDNEWTDCWGTAEGGYEPLERLEAVRRIYFGPGVSIGGAPLPAEAQSRDSLWAEFGENRRWEAGGVVFATIHMVGSWNGRGVFDGRKEADDRAADRRTAAAVAWLEDTFRAAGEADAKGVVLVTHAYVDPDTHSNNYVEAYEPFIARLEEEVAAYERPVFLVHGDDHEYVVDYPLSDRRTGEALTDFTRLQVPGSPEVGWVRVVVDTASMEFDFSRRRVAPWNLW